MGNPDIPTLRQDALLHAMAAVPFDIVGACGVSWANNAWHMGWMRAHGSAPLVERWQALVGHRFDAGWDPALPPKQHVNQLARFSPGYQSSDIWRSSYQPVGITHQRRVAVYHEGAFVCWVGIARCADHSDFTPQEDATLTRALPKIRRLALAEAVLRRGATPSLPGHVVLRPDGGLERACNAGKAWWSGPCREALQSAMRRVERTGDPGVTCFEGGTAHAVRLDGDSAAGDSAAGDSAAGVRYLWLISPAKTPLCSPTFSLSPREREIAALAAAGHTRDAIAYQLGISEQTVRHHLKQVYAALKVSSRVELARALDS